MRCWRSRLRDRGYTNLLVDLSSHNILFMLLNSVEHTLSILLASELVGTMSLAYLVVILLGSMMLKLSLEIENMWESRRQDVRDTHILCYIIVYCTKFLNCLGIVTKRMIFVDRDIQNLASWTNSSIRRHLDIIIIVSAFISWYILIGFALSLFFSRFFAFCLFWFLWLGTGLLDTGLTMTFPRRPLSIESYFSSSMSSLFTRKFEPDIYGPERVGAVCE